MQRSFARSGRYGGSVTDAGPMSSMHRGQLLQEALDRIDHLPIETTVASQLAKIAPAFESVGLVAWVHGVLDSYQQVSSGRSSSLSMFFVQLSVVSEHIDHVAHNAIRCRTRRIVALRRARRGE
jgi:hypothetical protein